MQGHYVALLPITKEYCSADEDRLFFTCLSEQDHGIANGQLGDEYFGDEVTTTAAVKTGAR